MCMIQTKEDTQEVAQWLERDGEIIAYKLVYLAEDGHLLSIFSPAIAFLAGRAVFYEYQQGENASNRLSDAEDYFLTEDIEKVSKLKKTYTKTVDKGIHVFLDEKTAISLCDGDAYIAIPVICKKEDFVGAGLWEDYGITTAVFTKVTITQEDYDKAVGATTCA